MRRILLAVLLSAAFYTASSQIFWTENFENGCSSACEANSYSGPNGPWTITDVGVNGIDANTFYVACAENGQVDGECGSACGTNNASLYVGFTPSLVGTFGDGAVYLAGGLGLWFPETDRRCESPVINCSGKTNITLDFSYIENGDLLIDNATLWYFDGGTWTQLADMPKTTLCGNGQGLWAAYSIALPASADNNANVKIGFRWVNNDDNVGTDPSLAVNDITLSSPDISNTPNASFTANTTTTCVGGCIDFQNTSTGAPFTSTNWTFTGSSTPTSTANNPTNICYPNPGNYTVSLVVTNGGGSDTETITNYISVVAAPITPIAQSNSPLCAGTTLNLTTTAIPGAVYTWTGPNGFTSASQNPSIPNTTVAMAGTYSLTISIGTCVSPAGTTDVVINAAPAAPTVSSNSPICEGATLTLNTAAVVGATYTWTGPNGFTSASLNPTIPGATAANSGTYSLTISTGGCPSLAGTTDVVVSAVPANPTITTNSPLCVGQDLNFSTMDVPGATYTWTGPLAFTASTFNPSISSVSSANAGTYTVVITAGSCSSAPGTATIVVNPAPASPVVSSNSPVCTGDPITLTATGSGATSYSWTGPNGFTSASQNPIINDATTAMSGTYTLVITNGSGCQSLPSNVSVLVLPPVALVINPLAAAISTGENVQLTVTGGIDYLWSPSTGLSCDDCFNPIASPFVTTFYTVTSQDANGCTGETTVLVSVTGPCGDVFIPTIFSPNGDENNDFQCVLGNCITEMEFKIFNRWGEIVFASSKQTECWDGNYHGNPVEPGAYVFTFTGTQDGKQVSETGTINVIR